MGFGFPAAIGAKLGRPDKDVFVISGDGSFQMCIQELATIAMYQIPVKILLFNNGFLGMVRQWQELFYGQRFSSSCLVSEGGMMKKKDEPKSLEDAYIPNFVKLAEAGEPAFRNAAQPAWLRQLETEHDNLRAALASAMQVLPATTVASLGTAASTTRLVRLTVGIGRGPLVLTHHPCTCTG